jgi:cephalosporin-C deacetylase-like acetyl esterase
MQARAANSGPGQGGALRQGIYFEHAWEKPAKALLDYFNLDAVDWLGASCGGYLSIRAAAFEPRIKHIISMPTSYSGLDMTLKQMRPGKAQELVSLFRARDRKATEALIAEERLPSSVFDTSPAPRRRSTSPSRSRSIHLTGFCIT